MSRTNILKALLFTPTSKGWGLPALFWAKPGVGKSDIIESSCNGWGLHAEVLSPGERGEGAFGVVPVPTSDGAYLSYPAPDWVARVGDGGTVFLDEINTAAPALQPYLLGIALAKRVGGFYMGARVRVLAAANPIECGTADWDLPLPLANRFGHFDWEVPSATDWSDWLMGLDADVGGEAEVAQATSAEALEAEVLAGWSRPWARARGLVAGFTRSRPGKLHAMPDPGDPNASRAWPSHRSWEAATRALASAQVHGLSEAEGEALAQGFVGEAAMMELVEYRHRADLPDPADLLDGKVSWSHSPARLDVSYAVLASCSALVAEKAERTDDRVEAMYRILTDVSEQALDLCWQPTKVLARVGLARFNDQAKELFARLLPATRIGAQTAQTRR